MEKPLVSIILPTYNREKYIKRAIESVWNQTYKNIELIIIDDGSIDSTQAIIREFSKKYPKMIILTNENNLGIVSSLNKGIKVSQGKYIARIDDDDFWHDVIKIEKQVNFLERNKEYVLVGGGVIKIDRNGKEILRYLLPERDEDIRKAILTNNVIAHTAVLFRRNIFDKVGGYDKHFTFLEDWDLWLKMGRVGKFYNFQEYFLCYLDQEYNNYGYYYRNYEIRRKVGFNIKLRKKYKNDYPNYKKAVLFCWLSYFYSFLPFKQELRLLLFNIKNINGS